MAPDLHICNDHDLASLGAARVEALRLIRDEVLDRPEYVDFSQGAPMLPLRARRLSLSWQGLGETLKGPASLTGRGNTETLTQVPLEVKRFRGSPEFDANGTMHMPPVDKYARWPENHKFTGQPSAEIDGNWMDLTGDRYFSISEEEAMEAWGDRRHEYIDEDHGGYTAGLDVFHTLDCLVSSRRLCTPSHKGPVPSLVRQGLAANPSSFFFSLF